MALGYGDLALGRRYEITLTDCCIGARLIGTLLAVDAECQEALFDIGRIDGWSAEFAEVEEANPAFGALLERALRWVLIQHKLELDELDERRTLTSWPDASGVYRQTINLIRDLCSGDLEPAEYLDWAAREDEQASE